MSAALSLFLAGLLAASALHKVTARDRLAVVTARLASVPFALGQPLLFAVASLEALAGLALLVPALHQAGAMGATVIWLGYGTALLRRRGEVIDCGCDLFAHERPVDLFAIMRPLLLASVAMIFAALPLAPLTLDAPFAALGLLALWFAAGELAPLPYLARMSRR